MYATIDDILKWMSEDELIHLTDDNDTGAFNTGIVEGILQDTSVEIDGYLESRYQLPLETVPGTIRKLCTDMAIYGLYRRKAGSGGTPDEAKDAYKNAVAFFRSVAKGDINLGSKVEDEVGSGESGNIQISGPERLFSRDSMKWW